MTDDADADTALPAEHLVAWRDAALSGELPLPTRANRWQPLRAGLVNMWEYDAAEVWYADGRLQLQGANESGKSTLMTLTTLLLLTADVSGHNIDTLGESQKRFRYYIEPTNHPLDRRETSAQKNRGWAWVEYGRQSDNGPEFFTTLLFAETRRADGAMKLQWCTVDGTAAYIRARVRSGITLANAGLVAEPGQLRDVPGLVAHKTGALYRDAVARSLFAADADWLDQIIRILRVVRTPKIGDRLNLQFLTEAFRTALPPLADDEVGQLADGWEQLERMRDERDTTEGALAAVTEFTRSRWRPWADAVIRSAADPVAHTTSTLTEVTRGEREAKDKVAVLTDKVEAINDQIAEARNAADDAAVQRDALQAQQAYEDAVTAAANAQHLADAARMAEDHALQAADRAESAQAQLDVGRRRLQEAHRHLTNAEDEVKSSAERVAACAQSAGLIDATARFLPSHDVARLKQAAEQRRNATDRALLLLVAHAEAAANADIAAGQARAARKVSESARLEEGAAAETLEAGIIAVAELLTTWSGQLDERLRPLPALVQSWARAVAEIEAADTPMPILATAVERAHLVQVRRPLESRAAELHSRLDETEALAVVARDELATAESETDPRPGSPQLWRRRTRPEGVSVAGAPLWRLVELATEANPDAVAALEATLDASGLLQAWVTPDGAYLPDRDGADTLWIEGATGGPASTDSGHTSSVGTLRTTLRPAVDAGPALGQVVDALLRSVAYGPTLPGNSDPRLAAVGADGRWRHGGLTGTAVSAADGAALLGAATRATVRVRRIAELRTRLDELRKRESLLETDLDVTRGDLAALDRAAERLPSDAPVVTVVLALREKRKAAELAADAAEQADGRATTSQTAADGKAAEVAAHADEHGLPRERKAIEECRNALHDYVGTVRELSSAVKHVPPVHEIADTAATDLADREAEHSKTAGEAQHAGRKATGARARANAAKAALTQEVQDIIGHVEEFGRAIERHGQHGNELDKQREGLLSDKFRAEATLEQVEKRRADAEEARAAAVDTWFACVDTGLPLLREVPALRDRHVTAALESARAARARITPRDWPDEPTETAQRMQRVQSQWARLVDDVAMLRSRLEPLGGRTVRTIPPGDGLASFGAVEVMVDATAVGLAPPTARARLHDQLDRLQVSYDEELERTINDLLGSTFIEHLRERLIEAERLRAEINTKLAENPTTTSGLTLRLVRVPVADEQAANEVLAALEKSFALLPDSTQEQVRQFLARRISDAQDEARAAGDPNWRSRLAEILDYRRWFELRLEYRTPRSTVDGDSIATGGWHRLDREDHSLLSGGAKVVTLLQPFVAALHAMYDQSGVGPRMMWLDEAFDGVDPDNRAMMLRLLAACDLDWMVAGPGLIANSRTVPMAAIYEVRRAPRPFPGVSLELALWAGGTLAHLATPDPADLPDLAGSTSSEPSHEDSLFSSLEGG